LVTSTGAGELDLLDRLEDQILVRDNGLHRLIVHSAASGTEVPTCLNIATVGRYPPNCADSS
jgi:hypothetical protein